MDIRNVTNAIYQACTLLEMKIQYLKDCINESSIPAIDDYTWDEVDFLENLYDELFDKTTEIEEYYGII